ncbi:hypothetical protein [Deinococcus soli (ex Cha et al. 2016)]|uniref:Uncharacterized protein n=2 Tax=Deinococcus soli (ex Cha et al. 2016) TaxID=1309411 RepID=A0ACC6KGU2_9DEIO|nr:hypothetical protein [Deinococcus soli (ex Cha et al. 2016)]MDR6218129.1 hypothetical protein [Deinococcus soli (ex Cha et al. 2016)]MDR6328869.1 hypothetical protein [Deinococcus soli (ex Cha et al. 2016)]MDR6751643.1 hypothetical protein [Deinococcus soli (ex Cha et al. 2016)]
MLPVSDPLTPATPAPRPLTIGARVERLLATFTQLTLMDIARALDSSPQNISTILAGLVKDGRAEREYISRPCVRQGQHTRVYGYTLIVTGPLRNTRRAPRLTKRAQTTAALSLNLSDPLEIACLHVIHRTLRGPLHTILPEWSDTERTEHLSLLLISAARAVYSHAHQDPDLTVKLRHDPRRAPHFTFTTAHGTLDVHLDTLMRRLLHTDSRSPHPHPGTLDLLRQSRHHLDARSAYSHAVTTDPHLATEITRYARYPAVFLHLKAQGTYHSRRDLHRTTEHHLDRRHARTATPPVAFAAATALSA